MYEEDLALDNLQRLICHKTQPNQTKPAVCGECLPRKSAFKIPKHLIDLMIFLKFLSM